jgi:hypothetical protein
MLIAHWIKADFKVKSPEARLFLLSEIRVQEQI